MKLAGVSAYPSKKNPSFSWRASFTGEFGEMEVSFDDSRSASAEPGASEKTRTVKLRLELENPLEVGVRGHEPGIGKVHIKRSARSLTMSWHIDTGWESGEVDLSHPGCPITDTDDFAELDEGSKGFVKELVREALPRLKRTPPEGIKRGYRDLEEQRYYELLQAAGKAFDVEIEAIAEREMRLPEPEKSGRSWLGRWRRKKQ